MGHWVRADFKGKPIWAQVDAAGQVVAEGGRVAIRYSDKQGTKIYRAGASGVTPTNDAPRELPEGKSADASKSGSGKSRGSGFGKAGTRTAAQAVAAKQSADALVAGFRHDAAVCFTDGACKGNPGPAGAGAVVKLPDGTVYERYAALGVATNNVGELSAIGLALDLLDEAHFPEDVQAEICTDSKYTFGLLELGWKAKSNADLVARLRKQLATRKVRLHWVAGHVGIPENERADALANEGVSESLRAG